MQIILNSLLRVVTIKLKKKSHFLLESQTIEEIIGKFKGYVGNLRPVQKLMLGKKRHIKPGNSRKTPILNLIRVNKCNCGFLNADFKRLVFKHT